MKLLKTVAMLFMGLLIADCMAAPGFATVHSNGIIEVKTGSYELSFFPGCMFPFRLKTGGRTLPEPVWLDRIVGMDGKQYFLNIDRFAERRIVTRTDREFCVEMSGTYCLNDDASNPGKVLALYRYTCRPDGIEVDVRISNPEGILWKELQVLVPGWKNDPWDRFAADDPSRNVNEQGVLQGGQYVSAASGNVAFALYGDRVTGYTNPRNKYYSYLSAFRRGKWKDTVIELKGLKIRLTSNAK
ncbi:MAG: hypothetical protein IJS01_07200 [Lentisphaeria bacterium]|nr:hypothetical protein [Lentisphaeria bacterium]